jgi:hypothetical protein
VARASPKTSIPSVRSAGLRHQPGRQEQAGQPDRQVDQEHRAPAQFGRHRGQQQTTDHLATCCYHPHRDRVGADRAGAGAVRAGEQRPDDGQDGRPDQGCGRTLSQSRGDQHACRGRHPAHDRGHGEQAEAEHEAAAPAPDVPDAAGHQEQDREGQAVAGHHPLQHGRPGVQLDLHRGQSHVDDEEVQNDQEGAGQQHGKRGPVRRGARSLLMRISSASSRARSSPSSR